MTNGISKVQRWLDLISLLVGRRVPVDVDAIMRGVPAYAQRWSSGSDTDRASVQRMFERDKRELRDLGIPLESVDYTINYGMEQVEGYRLARKNFYLPYLELLKRGDADPAPKADAAQADSPADRAPGVPDFELEKDEASLALDALDRVLERDAFPFRDDAHAARRKLTFDLDPDALERTPVHWVDPPGAEERASLLEDLSDALMRRKRVRFVYHSIHRDERSRREVEPWGLLFQHSHWYLVGRDLDREARRTFRVARMSELEVESREPGSEDYVIPDDFSLDELRDREAWELGDDEPIEAEIRFRFPRALWAERNAHGELVGVDDEGAQVRRFRVVQSGPFLRWVLGMAGEARILEPPQLRQAFEEMASRVATLYDDDDPDGDDA